MTFCLFPLKTKYFQDGINCYKKEFAPIGANSMGANSFLLELTPTEQ